MHHLIFIPDTTEQGVQLLRDAGLSDHVQDAMPLAGRIGPDAGVGCFFYWRNAANPTPQIQYEPSQQTGWPDRPEEPRYWVGVFKGDHPRPEELGLSVLPSSSLTFEHRARFRGRAVQLKDGQKWIVPDATLLPDVLTDDDNGRPCFQVEQQYRPFFEESREVYETLVNNAIDDGTGVSVDNDTLLSWVDYAARVLAMNYRFPPSMLTKLGLCGSNELLSIALASTAGRFREVANAIEPELEEVAA